MPRNVYSEINLHLTWHTKNNDAVLDEVIEARTHQYLRHRAIQTEGVVVHAVNGTADHIHMVVSVAPTVQVSDWVGRLKGATSHHINNEICNRHVLFWQDGYGVVSFGTRDLPWVISYVQNQKEHHKTGRTFERLERTDRTEPSSDAD
jgi:REP element-mobilizing transposase RayT